MITTLTKRETYLIDRTMFLSFAKMTIGNHPGREYGFVKNLIRYEMNRHFNWEDHKTNHFIYWWLDPIGGNLYDTKPFYSECSDKFVDMAKC